MPYSHYLQGIDNSFFENEEVTNYSYYLSLVNLHVLFTNSKVFFNEKGYYLGQFSEAAFNFYRDGNIDKAKPHFNILKQTLDQIYFNTYEYSNDNLLKLQETILEVNKEIKHLIIFDEKIKLTLDLVGTYEHIANKNNEPEAFTAYLIYLLISYILIYDTIIDFNEVFYGFSEKIITRVKKEDDEHYINMFEDYFNDEEFKKIIGTHIKFFNIPMDRMTHYRSYYDVVSLPNSNDKELVEKTYFDNYSSFLQQEYFKALKNGHTVRICNHCKRAFLQLTEQDTIYCDRIYKDTNQTCRKIGPSKFHKERAKNSPINHLYKKCYRKIYMQRSRLIKKLNNEGKPIDKNIDIQYNEKIALIIALQEKAFNGEISVIELEEKYKQIKLEY